MRHYEIILLIHPDQSNQISAMIERYLAIIAKGSGKVHRQEDWGKLQLAYQINKLHKAHYVLLNIECEKITIDELSNAFKFNDAVIRNLITKCDTAITEQSIFFKNKELEKSNKDSGHYGSSYSNQGGGYYNTTKDYESKYEQKSGYNAGTGSVDPSVTDAADNQ